jgi:Flp pilus assembly protein TadD
VDDAAVEYRQAIRLKPQLADAHCGLGNLLGAQEKFEEAKSELRVCVQLAPDNYEAHLGLGLILMREGKTAEARAQCQKAVESPDPSLRDAAQRALEQLGR